MRHREQRAVSSEQTSFADTSARFQALRLEGRFTAYCLLIFRQAGGQR